MRYKYALCSILNVSIVTVDWTSGGSLFQANGLAYMKALLPNSVHVLGISGFPVSAYRIALIATATIGAMCNLSYDITSSLRALWVVRLIMFFARFGTGIQFRSSIAQVLYDRIFFCRQWHVQRTNSLCSMQQAGWHDVPIIHSWDHVALYYFRVEENENHLK